MPTNERANRTAWTASVAVVAVAGALAACSLDSAGRLAPDASTGGPSAGPDAAIDVRPPDVACFPPNKLCDGICADADDPDYGCAPGRCDPCDPRDNGIMGCANRECVIAECEEPFWNCNGNLFDGCETDIWSLDHCGACGRPCAVAHAVPVCDHGECEIDACLAGWGNCDSLSTNGCETDLRTLDDCGQCGKPCSVVGGKASCATGTCAIDKCDPGRADCNNDDADGCETDLHTLDDCGACDRPCAPPNAVGACPVGECIIEACVPGFGDCNGDPVDGCEVNIRESPDHCGGCHEPCEPDHALARACSDGICLPTCESGWRDCNGPQTGLQDDGCERDVYSLTDCGDCDVPCDPIHATGACPQGICLLGTCDPGWDDCDYIPLNGCEQGVATDLSNCGQCGHVCVARPHSSPDCVGGACVLSCYPGWGDCNGSAADGCEVNTHISPSHCGACGHPCTPRPHATVHCTGGSCELTCDGGWDDCNLAHSDGCEADLSLPSSCGSCGQVCPARPHATSTCDQGTCGFVCDPGWEDCNGLASDGCEADLGAITSCGACGVVCPEPAHAAATCDAGGCGFVCDGGWGDCQGGAADGCETNLTTTSNCGACGNICLAGDNATATCVGGACGISCADGWANCNLDPSDGCEADLSLPAHCGSCNQTCPVPPHSAATCTSGVCGFTCLPGWTDCDGDPANGCETDLDADPNHCGACGYACPVPDNATATCASATCGFACVPGFDDCDGDPANGCEIDLGNDPDHCGDCATVCPSGGPNTERSCISQQCGLACVSGMEDCNNDLNDGCECPVGCCSDGGGCSC